MSEGSDQETGKGRLSLRPTGRLELGRTVDAGSVRQSFSHGRSKVVQVEVRKKRAAGPATPGPATPSAPASHCPGDACRVSRAQRSGAAPGADCERARSPPACAGRAAARAGKARCRAPRAGEDFDPLRCRGSAPAGGRGAQGCRGRGAPERRDRGPAPSRGTGPTGRGRGTRARNGWGRGAGGRSA